MKKNNLERNNKETNKLWRRRNYFKKVNKEKVKHINIKGNKYL
jgi:hypothetical protein